ncbi:MAG TPA: response regulator [Dongiaceae bacterium]|nr:response regulator [Dongiaceae bacterium]
MVPLSIRPIISIVDDDDSIRVAAGDLVTSLGFVALTFASAEAFLQSGDATRTSCLITDIQLPGMSGLDLQDRLRAEGYRLPIIVITAFPEPKLKRRAEAAGAVAFLVKPFDGRELIARIEEILSRDEGPSKP